ncbi:MAG: hypothetical protein ACR2P0_07940 [Acidimicrobiales bacterium]
MAAPNHVPVAPNAAQHYSSPPQRERGWTADRPGETVGEETGGAALGSPGPDQGFAMKLTGVFDSKIRLGAGEHRSDVDAGCIAVALKRASLYGRAPVVHDMRVAYTLFGFIDDDAPIDLIEFRKELFAQVHYSFHYFERRAIADLVADDVLRQTPDEITLTYRNDWRTQLGQS